MIVVQHQHDLIGSGCERVHEARQDGMGRRLRGLRPQQCPRLRAELRMHGFECGDQIGEELAEMIIGIIQSEPGHPSAEDCGLPTE